MIRSFVFLALLASAAAMIALRRRVVGRVLRIAFALSLPLATTAFCLCPPKRPMIVFAWGYSGGVRVLEPLTQNPWRGWLSMIFSAFGKDTTLTDEVNKYVRANWDGNDLYVDGWCGVCGKPYAPRGSFVLAILPEGFAYAKSEPNPKYQHLSRPVYISREKFLRMVLPYPLALSLLVGLGPWLVMRVRRRWIIPPGHCRNCAYNLTGNLSGVCPECGEPI